MEPVTNNDPIKQRPPKKVRTSEIKALVDGGKVTGDALKWCEIVCANNPPGQVLHIDPATLEALTKTKPPKKGTDEIV